MKFDLKVMIALTTIQRGNYNSESKAVISHTLRILKYDALLEER